MTKYFKRKILIITAVPPNKRGESLYVFNVLDNYIKKDVSSEIVILTHKDDFIEESTMGYRLDERIEVRRILFSKPFFRQFNWAMISVFIMRYRPHIIHVINPLNPAMFGGALGEDLSVPIFISKLFKGKSMLVVY